jgi:hypothetical protein
MLSSNISSCLEQLQPTIATQLHNIIALAQQATDPKLLALCSTYIDAALRQEKWTPPERLLTDKEKAFIAFTEQFTSSVSNMSDLQVQNLLKFSSTDDVYNFVNAIYVTDMKLRLEIVAGKVLV